MPNYKDVKNGYSAGNIVSSYYDEKDDVSGSPDSTELRKGKITDFISGHPYVSKKILFLRTSPSLPHKNRSQKWDCQYLCEMGKYVQRHDFAFDSIFTI